MKLRRIYVIGIFVVLSMFLALSNFGSKPAYAKATLPANGSDTPASQVNASELPNHLFMPAVTGESVGSLGDFAQISAVNGTVEMCYTSTENGREIDGALAGAGTVHLFAGVLNVTLDGAEHKAFCTDFHNEISTGCFSNSTIDATEPLVACTLQYFPPVAGLPLDEAAARQAAVWYFSDGFETSAPVAVKDLAADHIAFVLAKQAAGQCDALLTPTLTIDPSSEVNFLVPNGSGGYQSSAHEYTIQLKKGPLPIPNEAVVVTTNLGTLSSGANTGATIQVTTDANGEAKVTIAHNAPGTAEIVASTVVTLPNGIRVDGGVYVQKLALAGSDSFELEANATKQWEPGGTVVVRKFHDRDRNGVYNNPPDDLINWVIRYRQQNGNDFDGAGWTELQLGSDGTQTIGVQIGANYQFCESTSADWTPTTPVCFGGITAGSTVSFGNVQLPGLLITKYNDLNGNGIRDAGEPGLEGWQFTLRRLENGSLVSTYSGQTNVDGNLGFTEVKYPFEYIVSEAMQSGWYSSTSTTQNVDISEAALYTLTFGNLQPGSLVINKTWFSNNTQVDGVEPATICLQRNPAAPAHAPVPTVDGTPLTLVGGQYCTPVEDTVTVENLWPGSYTVSETPLAGWTVDVASQNRSIVSGESNSVTFRNDEVTSEPASLGDYVWNDTDQDGVQDTGETPVSGVTVTLSTVCGGDVLATQVTGADGLYLFDNLQPGNYVVQFTLPSGFVFTTANLGGNGATDSDASVITGCTPVISLSAGENDLTWDAGIYQPTVEPEPASLGDYVWHDTDNDGVQDAGETPVSGVTVTLSTVCGGEVLATQVTGADGLYLFDNLQPGNYVVQFTLPSGFVFTTANLGGNAATDSDANVITGCTATINLSAGENDVTWDAGIYQPTVEPEPASLGDYVWNDTDNDGVQDAGETPVSGVTVTLSTVCGGDVLATQVTGADGLYLFDNLQPGNYVVQFTLPSGFVFTTANLGGNAATDSDANVITGCTATINLSAGENDLTWDAGIYQPTVEPEPASLGDYVWNDTDQDGVQDTGETPVSGVTVTLSTVCGGEVLATQVTGADGLYLFDNLQPGNYVVQFTLPSGFVFTTANLGGNAATDSDASVITGCTPVISLSAGENDLTWDAGIYQPPVVPLLGALGDTVWFDDNKNGIQDTGEDGVPNVKVDLYSSDDTFLKTDTTDANGKYLFTELPAGSYYVKFANVDGYSFTSYNVDNNGQDAEDSDPLVPVVNVSVSTADEEGILGKNLAYTFFYTNTDSSRNAIDIVISTTVPVGSVFQPGASNANWDCTSTQAGGICTLNVDQLAPNAAGSAIFVVKLGTVGVPDPLVLAVTVGEGTSAQTEVVDLGAGETNLTVDAGIVRNQTILETGTSTGPTDLPGEGQPGSEVIFLPSVQS